MSGPAPRRRVRQSVRPSTALRQAAAPVVESLESRQLLSAGTFQNAFEVDGLGASNDTPTAVLRLSDGGVLVAASQNSSSAVLLARYLPDGTLDGTFGTG